MRVDTAKMKWPKPGVAILVHWTDITSLSGWREKAEVEGGELAHIATVGIFMGEENGKIKLCQSVVLDSDGDSIGEAMIIPVSVIQKVHRLK